MSNKQPYSPPPPYGFVPDQPQTQQPTQVIFTTVQGMATPVGPDSTPMTCPSCHASITTRIEKESTTKTHILALLFCVFFCWPCVILPYCCDCGKATNHYCPNCNAFVGSHNP